MTENKQPCRRCERQTLYWMLTIPVLAVMILVTIALWRFAPLLSFLYLGIWLFANLLEAFCCDDLKCPHAGKGCHPIGGFILAPLFYRLFLYNKTEKTRTGLNWFLELGSTTVAVSLIVFPVFWLTRIHPVFGIAYPLFAVLSVFTHVFLICRVCIVTQTCMMGMLQRRLWNGLFKRVASGSPGT